jgi:drug/metabolite transporter (DMT)-like permease
MSRAIAVVLFIVIAYTIGLRAIEHLPASVGAAILFVVPMIGFLLVVWAFEPVSWRKRRKAKGKK